MSLTELYREARDSGELVYWFVQDSSEVLRRPADFGVTSDGYCMGLAIQWVALRLQGKDYPLGPNKRLTREATYRAASDHATYEKVYHQLAAKDDPDERPLLNVLASNAVMSAYKLKAFGTPMERANGPNAGFLLDCAQQKRGIALISWEGEKGHATALDARLVEGRFNYFDANCGHFQFQGVPRFLAWFERYLVVSEYRKQFTKRFSYHPLGLLLE